MQGVLNPEHVAPGGASSLVDGVPLTTVHSPQSPLYLSSHFWQLMEAEDASASGIAEVPRTLFKELSLYDLWKESRFNATVLKEKELRRSQVGLKCSQINPVFPSVVRKMEPRDSHKTGECISAEFHGQLWTHTSHYLSLWE